MNEKHGIIHPFVVKDLVLDGWDMSDIFEEETSFERFQRIGREAIEKHEREEELKGVFA